jgi:hypothetical protein
MSAIGRLDLHRVVDRFREALVWRDLLSRPILSRPCS